MRVPLLDLKAQYQAIRRDTERAVEQVFADQQFVLGATVDRFEARDAEPIRVRAMPSASPRAAMRCCSR